MNAFTSFAGFAAQLAVMETRTVTNLHKALEKVAKKVEKTAKAEIGEYQDGIGEYSAWTELADSTKEDRVRKGFSENDPLLRTGALRDSISHQSHGLQAAIGSTSDIALYQELGTVKIPPRPFLSTALEHNVEEIKHIVGGAVIHGLTGTKRL